MNTESLDWTRIGEQAAEARQLAGYSQSQAARLAGVNRVTIAYLEAGERPVSTGLLQRLADIYHQPLSFLLGTPARSATRLAPLLYRATDEEHLSERARRHIDGFLRFLDCYVDILHRIGDHRTPDPSPFQSVSGYTAAEDAQRKAEEVRDHLGLRLAPIADLRTLLEALGATIYYASLGQDLSTTISGAFVKHEELGTCILVNSDISPGRQTFTLAHEYAHSLFHSHRTLSVACRSLVRDAKEVFADRFAAEFLVPMAALRRIMERTRLPKKIADPRVVIHLQQYFNVSYHAMLVRLRQGQHLTQEEYTELLGVSPGPLARRMGYEVADEDSLISGGSSRHLERFPRDFVEAVRQAYQQGRVQRHEAASALEISEMPSADDILAPFPSSNTDRTLQRRMQEEWESVAQATTR